MRILNRPITKNKLKNNIECVFKHSIACSAIKRHFFHRKFLVKNVYPQEVMKKITPCSSLVEVEVGVGVKMQFSFLTFLVGWGGVRLLE